GLSLFNGFGFHIASRDRTRPRARSRLSTMNAKRTILFRRNLLVFPAQRRAEGMPGQRGALYAGGKLAHSAEDGQLVQSVVIRNLFFRVAGDQLVEPLKGRFGLGDRLAYYTLGHQRRRRR